MAIESVFTPLIPSIIFNSPLLTGEAITVLPRSGALEGLLDRSYDNGFVGKDATGWARMGKDG